jgi:hypothetical protein
MHQHRHRPGDCAPDLEPVPSGNVSARAGASSDITTRPEAFGHLFQPVAALTTSPTTVMPFRLA